MQNSNHNMRKYRRDCVQGLNKASLVVVTAVAVTLMAIASGYAYYEQSIQDGKISMKAISWERAKELAEPDAGLTGHKVSVVNPADQTVIAAGTTDNLGMVELEVPAGTYTLLGASDEPQTVEVEAGKESKFKLIVH